MIDYLAAETDFVRHVRLREPLLVRVDGRSGRGVIHKPGADKDETAPIEYIPNSDGVECYYADGLKLVMRSEGWMGMGTCSVRYEGEVIRLKAGKTGIACKAGKADGAGANFSYGGHLTEIVLLGNVAYRSGKKIQWDTNEMRATNAPDAEPFIRRDYRRGWTLS